MQASHPGQRVRAALLHAASIGLVVFVAPAACTRDSTAPLADTTDVMSILSPLDLPSTVDAPDWIHVATADGQDQSVHPDVVEFDTPWHGFRQWHVSTPYPFSDRAFENPSIYAGSSNRDIAAPLGVVNPIVPGFYVDGPDYNSDPELLFDEPTQRLVMAYRQVKSGNNDIYMMDSPDGGTWSAPRLVVRVPSHGAVSPTIVPASAHRRALMFYVDAGPKGCSAASTTVKVRRANERRASLTATTWSNADSTDLRQPGYVIWHMKARYVPSKREYWAIYAAYPADGRGCGSDDLFLARSTNGMHWQTYPSPLLRHGDREWTYGALYRSTFLYDSTPDRLRVWLSARGGNGSWRIGFTSFSYGKLVERLSHTGGTLSPNRSPSDAARTPRPRWTDAP